MPLADELVGTHFAILDGDRVGAALELRLLQSDLAGAGLLSREVNRAVATIAEIAAARGATVIYQGGDEACLHLPPGGIGWLKEFQELFLQITGCTASIGVGETVQKALISLHRAKLLGGAQVWGVE